MTLGVDRGGVFVGTGGGGIILPGLSIGGGGSERCRRGRVGVNDRPLDIVVGGQLGVVAGTVSFHAKALQVAFATVNEEPPALSRRYIELKGLVPGVGRAVIGKELAAGLPRWL